ncbi:hypothetical protein USDA257_c00460 [Sinorhizobium fredii USDA 257]|uniref:Uncharacterized protein n=1 Tax=Sinorhizobium fredii (strain USDA 257) TaxID=1185652 RepID=I3WYE4_SINF2|nr:hypothetical protein USDA257_c00460 [Sinorhizobium fredii USDA 257]
MLFPDSEVSIDCLRSWRHEGGAISQMTSPTGCDMIELD